MSTVSDINRYTTAANAESDVATKITVTPEQDGTEAFFGKDGPSFQTMLDTINPLKHIPVVSDLMESDNADEKPSVASKLAGGLLFGGPIGFVASLANEIFEEATGKGMASAAYAALSGDTPTVQVASADTTPAPASTAAAMPQQVASLSPNYAALGQQAQSSMASAAAGMGDSSDDSSNDKTKRDRAMLDLYGASAPSAVRAYQKAQFQPYLNSVTSTQIL